MADILKKLGMRIKEERKKVGLTQERLAEKVDLSVDYIGYIERGKQAPYLKTLERIAKALGVEVHELFLFNTEYEIKYKKNAAIKELLAILQGKSLDHIVFITSILKQVFDKFENMRQSSSTYYKEGNNV